MRRLVEAVEFQGPVRGPGAVSDVYNGSTGDDVYVGTDAMDTISGGDGNDTLDGAGNNDVIYGGAGNNILNGGSGRDRIVSSGGADTVDGGTDEDVWQGDYATVAANLTFDSRAGTLSNGTTLRDVETVQLQTGYGDDTIIYARAASGTSGIGKAAFNTGAGMDDVTADFSVGGPINTLIRMSPRSSDGIQMVTSQDDHEVFSAREVERITLIGSGADDRVRVSEAAAFSAVHLDGGAGNDRLDLEWSGSSDVRFLVEDDGTIDSNLIDARNFEAFTISFATYSGDVTIVLGNGDDVVDAAATGSLRVDAGGGDDQVTTYLDSTTVVDGGAGTDRLIASFDDGSYRDVDGSFTNGAQVSGFETFDVSTGAGTLDLTTARASSYTFGSGATARFDGSELDTAVIFTVGYARIEGDPYPTYVPTYQFGETLVTGTGKVDVIGTAFDDTFSTYDDLLSNDPRVTSIDGGAGVDTLIARFSTPIQFTVADDGTITSSAGLYSNLEKFDLTLSRGENVVTTGDNDDVITGAARSDKSNTLNGAGGDDKITSGGGNDLVSGGDGNDLLVGGYGDDRLNGGAGNDVLDGGGGIDTAGYAAATAGVHVALIDGQQDTRGAGVDLLIGIENLIGSGFVDVLTGNDGANELTGLAGNDRVFGGGGDDRLQGGQGADRVTGGAGADAFVFASLGEIAARDRILDFSHADGDRIDLSAIDPARRVAGDQAFTFIGTGAFTGSADLYEVRVVERASGVQTVQLDIDHDGKADYSFAVVADAPLVAGDFVV